jgi:hypothetical protein
MKEKKETIADTIKEVADVCKQGGENNLAIVLYTYLASKKMRKDGDFAAHCQKFSHKLRGELDDGEDRN